MRGGRLVEHRGAAAASTAHPGGPGGLFQSARFFALHTAAEGRYFEWFDGGQVVASIHASPQGDGMWRSPARGTYAGYAVRPGLQIDGLLDFHDAVDARLRELGARGLEILPAPMAHDPAAFSNQVYALRSRGFDIGRCDLNQSLVVDARPLVERMSHGNRKRLAKCEREGYRCEPVGLEALPAVYDTVAMNRAAKGHAMSMTLGQLQTMADALPGALQLFACQGGGEMAAAAVCLRLDARTLYVFYWGDRPGHAQHSPVVAVAEAVYRHAQAHGFSLLDAGTSTLDADPNPGLLRFKRGLGFDESLKLRLEKHW